MPLPPDVAAALRAHDLPLREDEPLAKKTWWRTGGPADGYLEVDGPTSLIRALRTAHAHQCPVFVLGNASNLLVSDAGLRGLVIRLTGELAEAQPLPERQLKLGGGLKLVGFLRRAPDHGWTGLEMLAGVPGTVGGAVRMNAGTREGEICERIVDVEVVRADGTPETLNRRALGFAYRHSALPLDAVVAHARVQLTDEDPEASRARVNGYLDYRARTQPHRCADLRLHLPQSRRRPCRSAHRSLGPQRPYHRRGPGEPEACELRGQPWWRARVGHPRAHRAHSG